MSTKAQITETQTPAEIFASRVARNPVPHAKGGYFNIGLDVEIKPARSTQGRKNFVFVIDGGRA